MSHKALNGWAGSQIFTSYTWLLNFGLSLKTHKQEAIRQDLTTQGASKWPVSNKVGIQSRKKPTLTLLLTWFLLSLISDQMRNWEGPKKAGRLISLEMRGYFSWKSFQMLCSQIQDSQCCTTPGGALHPLDSHRLQWEWSSLELYNTKLYPLYLMSEQPKCMNELAHCGWWPQLLSLKSGPV